MSLFMGRWGGGRTRGTYGEPTSHRKYWLHCLRLTLTVVLRFRSVQAHPGGGRTSTSTYGVFYCVSFDSPDDQALLGFAQQRRPPKASKGGGCMCLWLHTFMEIRLSSLRYAWGRVVRGFAGVCTAVSALGHGNGTEIRKNIHSTMCWGVHNVLRHQCLSRSWPSLLLNLHVVVGIERCRPPATYVVPML